MVPKLRNVTSPIPESKDTPNKVFFMNVKITNINKKNHNNDMKNHFTIYFLCT